ncbi:hypothetical protein EVAR_14433_1 [Eumeta japonica]|uniref:Uncharacterized protein n=1 Tax=Eumeta variegata TaxID=151549 RepID=A0A4C1TX75_EUMVA|nr:hypothetical protein EVAR_14433_1 [Eumeta japonica]
MENYYRKQAIDKGGTTFSHLTTAYYRSGGAKALFPQRADCGHPFEFKSIIKDIQTGELGVLIRTSDAGAAKLLSLSPRYGLVMSPLFGIFFISITCS